MRRDENRDLLIMEADSLRSSRGGTFQLCPNLFVRFQPVESAKSSRTSGQKRMMESTLVRRDQFSISPQGIIHKPTDAAFTPHFSDPRRGTIRLGSLGNKHPNGNGYRPEDVQRMMRELWAEHVAANSEMFKR